MSTTSKPAMTKRGTTKAAPKVTVKPTAPLLAPEIDDTYETAQYSGPAYGSTAVWNGREWVPAPLYSTTPQNSTQTAVEAEPESFIVQNQLPSPHMITDMAPPLTFGSFEVIDLTWYPHQTIKASAGLKRSLRLGILRKISADEWESILDRESAIAKAEAERHTAKRQRKVNINGKQYEADVEHLDRASSRNNSELVNTAGTINDPLTYANQIARARAEAEANGLPFDAATWGRTVTAQGRFSGAGSGIPTDSFKNGSTSGTTRPGRYTVATAPTGGGSNPSSWDDRHTVAQGYTKNFNRDQMIPGASEMGIGVFQHEFEPLPQDDWDDDAYGEEINLNEDLDGTDHRNFRRR